MATYLDNHRLDASALACGIAVPIVYFGIQMASAPYYPDYSFSARDASALGSSGSTFPALFNVGMVIDGLLILFASFGVTRALSRVGVKPWFVWAILVALVAGALASIHGGVFPLPDQRHTDGLLAQTGAAMFLLPILMPFALRSVSTSGRLQTFLWINLAILLCLVPIVSGLIQRISVISGVELPLYQAFLNNGHGVLQRVAAAAVFVPIGVVCWYFLATRDRPTVAKA